MSSVTWRGWTFMPFVLVVAGSLGSARGQSPNLFPSPQAGLRVDGGAYSVVYRPPSVAYRTWEGEQFDIIYQVGAGDMARRTRTALDSSWEGTQALVGPVASDFHTPVVINAYNDRGNGFVQPLPFHQEIEAASNKTEQLVARSTSWPALVAPHEAVHSAHADVHAGVGVGGLVRVFAPDAARALNLTAPRGLVEGVAVHRESQLESDAGRMHAPLFTMKMKAAMLSDDPWNITQMLQAPSYEQPFNRHYVAGGHAVEALAERGDTTDTDFFRDAVTWHNRFPFLGHGVWLGLSTGAFPYELTAEMRSTLQAEYATELDRRRPFTPMTTIAGERGLNHRRPYWLDEKTLVAYVHGYAVRPGFYRIDTATGRRTPLRIQSLTEDRRYGLGRDTTALFASRYVPDSLVPSQNVAEVERVDLQTGQATRLTDGGRAVAPAEGRDGRIHVVRNDGPFTRWAVLGTGDTLRSLTPAAPTSVRQVAPAPDEGPIALLVNVAGDQRLYRAILPDEGSPRIEPWLGLAGAVIYDVSWGPEGRYLLFAADHPESATVFAFDTETKQVLQLANVPFGALEPALSPDQSTVAFVNYRHQRHDLVRIPFRPDSATVVPDSVVTLGEPAPRRTALQSSVASVPEDSARSYAAWRHLAPRMVYPTLRGDPEDWDRYAGARAEPPAVGVEVAGADPLKRWAYRGTTYWQDARFWGEARVESGRFLLRPALEAYNRAARLSRGGEVGVEERGLGLGLRLPVTLRSNVYQSLLRIGLETQLRQTRFYGGPLEQATPYSTRLTFNPSAAFGYRLQQNPRDLMPNTGVVVSTEGEFDGWVDADRPETTGAHRALVSGLSVYLPTFRDTHTGLRLGVGFLTQNRPTVGTTGFVPRGYDQSALPGGTYLRFDAEMVQPLWYIDDGLSLIPFYAEALSLYGFGQSLGRTTGSGWQEVASSVGAGIGLRARLFFLFDFNFRFGFAYRIGRDDVTPVFR